MKDGTTTRVCAAALLCAFLVGWMVLLVAWLLLGLPLGPGADLYLSN